MRLLPFCKLRIMSGFVRNMLGTSMLGMMRFASCKARSKSSTSSTVGNASTNLSISSCGSNARSRSAAASVWSKSSSSRRERRLPTMALALAYRKSAGQDRSGQHTTTPRIACRYK
eukprot:GHUV01057279.1.p2 GENE.GHUV01057279.1~~GHUV01057279.1.p2  ORF type:complete len:116 (-),score=8.59 GHUV01057279.1:848-1195(-)